jgi:hypothetical protein
MFEARRRIKVTASRYALQFAKCLSLVMLKLSLPFSLRPSALILRVDASLFDFSLALTSCCSFGFRSPGSGSIIAI